MAVPVVTVASGGLPVADVTATVARGLPVSEAGRGTPVTKVAAGKPGLPVVYVAAALQQGPPAAPSLLSASVTSTSPAPTQITLVFTSALQTTPLPAPADFVLVRNFVSRAPQSVAITGNQVRLTMDADYGDPGGGTVSYTPGANPLKGTNGLNVAAFSNVPVAP